MFHTIGTALTANNSASSLSTHLIKDKQFELIEQTFNR